MNNKNNVEDIFRYNLRNAINEYFLSKKTSNNNFMLDAAHRDVVSILDDVCNEFENNYDNAILDLN